MAGLISGEKIVELAQASEKGSDAAKKAHLKAIGDISGEKIQGTSLLVVTYIAREKTRGGIIRPPETLKEDEIQGTTGLVVKIGEGFFGEELEAVTKEYLHQWVKFQYNDGARGFYNRVHCRIIDISRVRSITPDPERWYDGT